MENKLINDRKRIKQLSEDLDSLIKIVRCKGPHGPDIGNRIKELTDMIKALDHGIQPCGTDLAGDEHK